MVLAEKVYFKIYGEDFTRLVRSIWADERRPDKALRLVLTGIQGIDEALAVQLLTGKKKFTGCSSDKRGLLLVDDDQTETEHGNPLGLYEIMAREMRDRQDLTDDYRDMIEMADPDGGRWGASPGGMIKMPRRQWARLESGEASWEELSEYWEHKRSEVEDQVEARNKAMKQMAERAEEALTPEQKKMRDLGTAKLDRMVARAREDRPHTNPKRDLKLKAKNGWVNRNGDFYPCPYMGHDELADDLGFSLEEIEEKGWVKISNSEESPIPGVDDVFFVGKGRPTKKQINTVFDWCQKYGRKMPEWMMED